MADLFELLTADSFFSGSSAKDSPYSRVYAIFASTEIFLLQIFFFKGVYAVFLRQKFKKNSAQKMSKKCVCVFLCP